VKEVQELIQKFIFDIDEPSFKKICDTQARGKMIRAKLILEIAQKTPRSVALAAIVECIHFASLLHDDVIDDANIRRGKPSINAQEGSKLAVMMGDIFYAKAFGELVFFGEKIAKIISSAVVQLAKGEFQDVMLSKSFNQEQALYENMIYLKTASLIEASCEAAAILAGKSSQNYKI